MVWQLLFLKKQSLLNFWQKKMILLLAPLDFVGAKKLL
jgi:hypothetical protein